MDNANTAGNDAGNDADNNKTVLMLWTSAQRGLRGMRRSLAGSLRAQPHGLDVVELDLLEALSGGAMVSRVAGMVDGRLEAALVASLGWPEVKARLAGRDPMVVVALDPVAASAADTWRGKGLLRAPLVGVTCGLRLDPDWAATAVDRLSVADEVMAGAGLEAGLPAECLVPCGVPVCGGFSTPSDEWEEYRRHFGLPLDKPVVLVVADGLEEHLTGVLFQLSMLGDQAALLFDVDKDERAADLLRRRAALYEVGARMFGKVDEAGQLWAACSLVVGRPHLYIEQRVVNLRLPFVCLMAKGKAEAEAADQYAARGIGRRVDNMATLAAEMDLLLAPSALEKAGHGMVGISRGKAVKHVARMVAQVGAHAEEILEEGRKRAEEAARPPEPVASDEPQKKKGPLEFIGTASAEPADPQASSLKPQAGAEGATLADIEAAEAEAGKQVLDRQGDVDRWERRAALAREKGDDQLLKTAEAMIARQREEMHRALAELARLAEQRQANEDPEARRLKLRKLEKDFKQLEVDDALAALKKKLGF